MNIKRHISGCGEKGQVFVYVLIFLLLGSLIIPPTLNLMKAGIIAGEVIETRTLELYAADSGIDAALLWMKDNPASLPTDVSVTLPDFTINDKQVSVTISKYPWLLHTYQIVSEAKVDGVIQTEIETFVQQINLPIDFLDNAITSPGNVTLKPGTEVTGAILYNGYLSNKGDVDGDILTDPITNWPTSEEVSDFYFAQVPTATPYPDDRVNVATVSTLGPIYREGDLDIYSNSAGYTLTLTGTIYVDGNLTVAQGGNKKPIINLNGQTLFVTGSVYIPANSEFVGTGAIIAIGDINYQPNSSSSDFTFLMSLEGTTLLKPGSDFVGSVAGSALVELYPNCTLTHVDPPDSPPLNVPDFTLTGDGGEIEYQVLTHTITTQ
jgi:hypothetical protein